MFVVDDVASVRIASIYKLKIASCVCVCGHIVSNKILCNMIRPMNFLVCARIDRWFYRCMMRWPLLKKKTLFPKDAKDWFPRLEFFYLAHLFHIKNEWMRESLTWRTWKKKRKPNGQGYKNIIKIQIACIYLFPVIFTHIVTEISHFFLKSRPFKIKNTFYKPSVVDIYFIVVFITLACTHKKEPRI